MEASVVAPVDTDDDDDDDADQVMTISDSESDWGPRKDREPHPITKLKAKKHAVLIELIQDLAPGVYGGLRASEWGKMAAETIKSRVKGSKMTDQLIRAKRREYEIRTTGVVRSNRKWEQKHNDFYLEAWARLTETTYPKIKSRLDIVARHVNAKWPDMSFTTKGLSRKRGYLIRTGRWNVPKL
jgi:hypothetical protein